jgi:acetylornithine/N-succinyldiaminopimelate aminotransferase
MTSPLDPVALQDRRAQGDVREGISMTTQETIDLEQKYILQTYGRPGFVLERGEGMHLFDTEGKKYLDFVSGLSVNALGYGNKMISDAAAAQTEKLIHVSNLYHTIPAPQLAQLLCESSFADRVFFCNSGTESWEAALKFARKYAFKQSADNPKTEFVAMNQSFHGRTYGSISSTGQPKYHQGFGPMLPGISFADFNDLESVEKQVNANTAAVLVEPLQAEGGIHPADVEFLKGLRTMCDEMGMLLVFDEIQCGLCRTGTLWCYEQYDVTPDNHDPCEAAGRGIPDRGDADDTESGRCHRSRRSRSDFWRTSRFVCSRGRSFQDPFRPLVCGAGERERGLPDFQTGSREREAR